MDMPSVEMIMQYDMVPGTVHLMDLTHQMNVAHLSEGVIVLVPQPSDDPRDPLRWSRWKKRQSMTILFFYGLITAGISGYTSSSIADIIAHNPFITFDDLSHAAAIATLFAGWGNVIFMPMSNKLGRRSVYLLSLALLIVGQGIYLAMSNRSMYLAQAAISGIGIAPFEALIEISISDIYFAHERGAKLGLYIASIAGGSFFGPLVGGYIDASMGWDWILKLGMIFLAVLWLAMFFFLPESRFIRDKSRTELAFDPEPSLKSDADVSGTSQHKIEAEDLANSKTGEVDLVQTPATNIGVLNAPKTGHPNYALWTVFPSTWAEIVEDTIQPFRVIWYPLIFWTGIVYGSCVCWLDVEAVTVASIFAAPPYLWSPGAIGNLALAAIIGTVFGSIYSGPLTNMWVLRMTRKNNGFREPEFRLYSLIPGAFIMGGGLIMYGVGAAHGLSWVLPAFGMGFVAFALTIGGAVMMGFVIDCYKEIAPQAVTCVIIIRNTMGFAVTFGTIEWVTNQGLQNTFITMGVLAWAIFISGVIFIMYGKRLRKVTAMSYLNFAALVGHK